MLSCDTHVPAPQTSLITSMPHSLSASDKSISKTLTGDRVQHAYITSKKQSQNRDGNLGEGEEKKKRKKSKGVKKKTGLEKL